jgi:hypothetical protein
MQLNSIQFDPQNAGAIVTATTSAELLVDKLPKNYRLKVKDATDTKIEAPNDTPWVRRDGQWYFRMDSQIVNGMTGDGRGVQPMTGDADDQEGGVLQGGDSR